MKSISKQDLIDAANHAALQWWNNLPISENERLEKKHFPELYAVYKDEIVHIYEKEIINPQPKDESKDDSTVMPVKEDLLNMKLWRDDDGFIAQGTGDNYKTFADTNVNDDDIDDREKRTDDIIAAYNGTIVKGYSPAAMEELYKALELIIDRIKENEFQGNFPSAFERAETALQNAKTIKP